LTWYQVSAPKELVNGNDNYMNNLINDGDCGERKQYIEWLPSLGKELDFGLWHTMVL
jgi:hypothetical protein